MKKLYYLIVLALILGLVLTGCLLSNVGQVPATDQSGIAYLTRGPGNMTVVSDTNTMVTEINNADVADQNAVLCWVHPSWWGGLDATPPGGWDSNVEWIWDTFKSDGPSQTPIASITGRVVTFQKDFSISGVPTAGTLYIAVDNGYEVWLNGTLIGHDNVWPLPDGVTTPSPWRSGDLKQGNVDWTNWQHVSAIDVSTFLVNGNNTLIIVAANEYMNTDDTQPSGTSWPRTGGPASGVGNYSNNPGGVVFQLDVEYKTEAPGIDVEKTCPISAYVGDTITYEYTVRNSGDVVLYDVALVDDIVGSIELTGLTDEDGDTYLDDLAVGAEATGTAYYDVPSDVVSPLVNIATATGTSPLDVTVNAVDNCSVVICYDETAWANGEDTIANNSVADNSSNAWGWTNKFGVGTEFPELELWAAAGQNNTDNGFLVGTVTVDVVGDCVTVTYTITADDEDYMITEAHLWVGDTLLPIVKQGKKEVPTSAPGQFPFSPEIAPDGKSATIEVCEADVEGLDLNDFWVAAHAVIEWCEEEEE